MQRHPRTMAAPRVLNRLRASPWVRLSLVVLAVGFCAYGLVVQRADVTAALRDLHWYSIVLATAAAIAGLGCMMLAWRSLLADLGSRLRLHQATRVMFVGQLGKYVPGMVWAFAAQVELAREHDVPRRRSASATVIAIAITLATGLVVAATTLPLTSRSAAEHYWWALACAPLILIALYPPLFGGALGLLLRLARRPPLQRPVSLAGLPRCLAWTLLGWACYGVQLWLLVADVTGRGSDVLLLSVGAYALAWSAGFVLVIFPSGVGPRELAMIAALAPVLPRGSALVVAIVSRLVMTVGDLAWAGFGLLLGRGAAAPPRALRRGSRADPASDYTGPEGAGAAAPPGQQHGQAPAPQARPPV